MVGVELGTGVEVGTGVRVDVGMLAVEVAGTAIAGVDAPVWPDWAVGAAPLWLQSGPAEHANDWKLAGTVGNPGTVGTEEGVAVGGGSSGDTGFAVGATGVFAMVAAATGATGVSAGTRTVTVT